jgi:hypothetical protein
VLSEAYAYILLDIITLDVHLVGSNRGFTVADPLGPGINGGLYRASDHSIGYGHVACR